MIEKIEEFLFDILGLAVPGVTLMMLIILLPVIFVDSDKAKFSFDLTEQTVATLTVHKINNESKVLDFLTLPVGITVFLVSYLIGPIVKMLSMYQYELCSLIFDKCINRIITFIRGKLVSLFNERIQALDNALFVRNKTVLRNLLIKVTDYLRSIGVFICSIVSDVFSFKPPDYATNNEWLVEKNREKLQERIDYKPSGWYPFYKVSNVIFAQDKVPTLSIKYLAKYNLYRSLAFIFLLNIFYMEVFFSTFSSIINAWGNRMFYPMTIISFIAWLTFHKKFKRYWTLCGNETIISVYYHLHKGKVTNG